MINTEGLFCKQEALDEWSQQTRSQELLCAYGQCSMSYAQLFDSPHVKDKGSCSLRSQILSRIKKGDINGFFFKNGKRRSTCRAEITIHYETNSNRLIKYSLLWLGAWPLSLQLIGVRFMVMECKTPCCVAGWSGFMSVFLHVAASGPVVLIWYRTWLQSPLGPFSLIWTHCLCHICCLVFSDPTREFSKR